MSTEVWIDDGTFEPLPWPHSRFIQAWLNQQGYDDVRGKIGMRRKATTPPAGSETKTDVEADADGGMKPC